MKNYLRVLASSTLLIFGLAAVNAYAQTSTDTSTTSKSKRKRKSKDTTSTAPAMSTAASAPAATTPSTMSKPKGKSMATANASDSDIAAAKASGKVWVNLDSGVYHKSGQFYGKTKKGQFMTEDEAKKAGYHQAKSEIGTKKS